jgi:hypothetical protein
VRAVADVVLDFIAAGAVSKVLAEAGFTKDQKVGRQSRPYEALPRTGGYRATQGPRSRVEVWYRTREGEDRAEVYAQMTKTLTERGYQAERDTTSGRDGLMVTRRRPPTALEWGALDLLAARPMMLEVSRSCERPWSEGPEKLRRTCSAPCTALA